jgi:ssDNA-binding Zn-finger/Zn-ribbon topoisomerase 1
MKIVEVDEASGMESGVCKYGSETIDKASRDKNSPNGLNDAFIEAEGYTNQDVSDHDVSSLVAEWNKLHINERKRKRESSSVEKNECKKCDLKSWDKKVKHQGKRSSKESKCPKCNFVSSNKRKLKRHLTWTHMPSCVKTSTPVKM